MASSRKHPIMSAQASGYVSVIGFSLLEAVVDLVGRLEGTPTIQPNEVQASQLENGYAAAIVVLSAAVVESALNRTRYVRGDGLATGRESVTTYWQRIGPTVARNPHEAAEFAALAADLNECFAVRDAIVHSHLWEAQVVWADSGALQFAAPPQLRPGFGDQRFRAVLDPQTRQSRKLSLNLFPSRIWRRDFEAMSDNLRTVRVCHSKRVPPQVWLRNAIRRLSWPNPASRPRAMRTKFVASWIVRSRGTGDTS
jgi:hypothetical protein